MCLSTWVRAMDLAPKRIIRSIKLRMMRKKFQKKNETVSEVKDTRQTSIDEEPAPLIVKKVQITATKGPLC